MKKYKLAQESITIGGRTLYRIEAARNFGNVIKGQTGGFIESEENLSHDGNARVCGDAQVYGNARVRGEARVYGGARVRGEAEVGGETEVYNGALK